jgi:glycosyltransferase involved in cell wall biosynthesis
MRFTIITPTLQRSSLVRTCNSVDSQSYSDWQHIVMVDRAKLDRALLAGIHHPQRSVIKCPVPHHNYGNTCRHNAWELATGDYCLMLDDDNYLTDDKILEDIAASLEDRPHWALFPILRRGKLFFHDPPGLKVTDTANVVVRREIARWPDILEYAADARWVEGLKAYPHKSLPDFRPIVDMPIQSKGRSSAKRWDIREKVARTWRDIGLLYNKRGSSTPL